MSLLAFTAGIALTVLCASMLARALDLGGPPLARVFWVVALFPVVVTLAALAAGMTGLLHARGLCLLLGAAALAGVGHALWRRLRGGGRSVAASPPADGTVAPLDEVLSAAAAVACLVPAWLLGRELLLGVCRFDFDDLAYHGLMLAHWLQRDALHLAPAKYQAYYPGGSELFSAFFIELGGGDAFAQLASVYWALLATLCFPVAGTALGARQAGLLVAAGLLLCSPIVLENLGTIASVDMAAGAAALATLAAALLLSAERRRPHRDMLLLGALAGLAVGIKVTVLVLVAPVLIGFAVHALRGRLRSTLPVTVALAGLLGGVVTGGYWYIRNTVLTGNPVFPAELLWFDGPLDRAFQRSTSLLERLLDARGDARQLDRIERALFDWPRDLAWVGSLGVLYALLVAPWLRRGAARWLLPALALIAAAFTWVVIAGPFSGSVNAFRAPTRVELRMFLPSLMLALLLAGAACGSLRSPRLRWIGALATLAGIGLIAKLVRDQARVVEALCGALALVALGWGARILARRSRWLPSGALAIAGPSCALLAVGVMAALVSGRQSHFDGKIRGWLDGALAGLPDGSRIATPNIFSYYALFGANFELDPFRVDDEGRPHPPLHVRWATDPHFSWKYEFGAKWKPGLRAAHEARLPKTGWRAIEDPEEQRKARDRELLASLRATGADYVAVASSEKASILHGAKPKRRDKRFPRVQRLLDASPEFERVRSEDHIVLWKCVRGCGTQRAAIAALYGERRRDRPAPAPTGSPAVATPP